MADYSTEFSCILNVGLAENAEAALAIRAALAAELEEAEQRDVGFELEADPAHSPGELWISSDGNGEPEHVIAFVLRCAEAFDLTGRWGFVWALTCSKPRFDGFGGRATNRPRRAPQPRLARLRALARQRPRSGARCRCRDRAIGRD